jgi:amino acid adenylation domain-containing protein
VEASEMDNKHKNNTSELNVTLGSEREFWLKELTDLEEVSEFPAISIKPSLESINYQHYNISISQNISEKIFGISNGSNYAVYAILLSAVFLTLNRYTGNNDLLISIPILKDLIKDNESDKTSASVLPFRSIIPNEEKYKNFLSTIANKLREIYKNTNFSIDRILKEVNPNFAKEGLNRKLIVSLNNIHDIKNLINKNFEILIVFQKNSDYISMQIEYNQEKYNDTLIRNIANSIVNCLNVIIMTPDIRISDIDILSVEEKNKIIYDFNNTDVYYNRDATIHGCFEASVQRNPDNIAVEFNDKYITYRDLNKYSNKIAREINKIAFADNKQIAVFMDRSIYMIASILGILKAGGTYIPLENSFPESRIVSILNSLNINCIVIDQVQLKNVINICKKVKSVKTILCMGEDELAEYENISIQCDYDVRSWNQIKHNEDINLTGLATSEDIAYIIFTSGSTGIPKGVVVKHKPVINVLEWVNNTFNINEDDKLLFVTSLCFDLSVYDVFGILASGGTIVLAGNDDINRPDSLLNLIYEKKVTFWDSAPASLQQLLLVLNTLNHDKVKSTLRLVFLSGDWIPINMPKEVWKHFQNTSIVSLGGATEATIWSNYFIINSINPAWNSIPYGKPIQNAKYYILDKYFHPCPIGVQGDLYIGGECLSTGYINDQELTHEKYLDNPFIENEKIYKTGDLARWLDDGNMEFLGRADYQVKVRGYRIEIGEIVSTLLQHEEIREAVVIVKKEENKENHLFAYITGERKFSSSEIRKFISSRLPAYMVPSYIIQLDKIPYTANGKVDRKNLIEMKNSFLKDSSYEEPSTDIQRDLVNLYSNVLGLERIGINDSFFDLGGHSIKATILLIQLNNKYNTNLSLKSLYSTCTIKELAKLINIEKSAKKIHDNENVILLRQGEEEGKNLFIIHDGSGEVSAYYELSQLLDSKISIWGIKSNIQYTTRDYYSIQEIAEKYLEQIRNIQPEAPYYIAGWCIGGTIAFEIVEKLEERNLKVDKLLLIDVPGPDANLSSHSFNSQEQCSSHSSGSVREYYKSICKYFDNDNIDEKSLKLLLDDSIINSIPFFDKLTKDEIFNYINTLRLLDCARTDYIPQRLLNTNVSYINAIKSEVEDPYKWSKYCQNPIRTYTINSDHYSLFKMPEVLEFSMLINSIL